jgi:hypothetical protein
MMLFGKGILFVFIHLESGFCQLINQTDYWLISAQCSVLRSNSVASYLFGPSLCIIFCNLSALCRVKVSEISQFSFGAMPHYIIIILWHYIYIYSTGSNLLMDRVLYRISTNYWSIRKLLMASCMQIIHISVIFNDFVILIHLYQLIISITRIINIYLRPDRGQEMVLNHHITVCWFC